jgi:YfiR/HmsC-like
MALLGCTFRLPPLDRTIFRSLSRFFVLLILTLSFSALDPGRAQENSKEYQLKAVFLFDFAQFVKWPSGCFPNPDAPFCIGILGDDPFGSTLEATIQGETVNNHKLRVVRGRTFEDLKDCQLIFISKSEESHVAEIFSKLDSKPILTVSEINSFAQNGGIIDFYLQGNKVRFEINPDSAQRRGLKISSQLLTLGKIVTSNN